MCTVIVGYKLFPRHPLVIAANRDELLDRASEPPGAGSLGGLRTIAPRDLQRGGTWIGVNERGVFAAVTNRHDVASVRGQKSRGELVNRVLEMGEDGLVAALYAARKDDARDYNGYHLIVGDAEHLWVLAGDGKEGPERPRALKIEEPGLVIVSNLGIGPAHAPRAEEVERVWIGRRLARTRPHRATWDALLTIHDPRPDGSEMKRMASTCIHRPAADNYGTKSSAFILLDAAWGNYGPEWRWWHRERPDGGTHNCAGRWRPELKLPIVPSGRDG